MMRRTVEAQSRGTNETASREAVEMPKREYVDARQ